MAVLNRIVDRKNILPALDFADGILTVNDFFVNACGQTALGTVAVRDLLVYPAVHKKDEN